MKNDLDRVRFFSVDDMFSGMMLEKAEKILKGFDESARYEDINDVIELYHIRSYIEEGLFLNRWTEEEKTSFKTTTSKFWGIICRFFNCINDNNFTTYHADVDWGYEHSFWELFDKSKTYERISKEVFRELLGGENIGVNSILEQKNLIKYYDSILRDFLLSYKDATEIILSKYEVKKDSNYKQIYLPSSLTDKDKIEILNNYLDWEDANMNYVELIITARNSHDFNIPDTLRLKAQKRYKSFMEATSSSSSAMKIEYKVSLSKTQIRPKVVKYDNGILCVSYSLHWMQQNSDIISLFKNFIYLLEFLDRHNLISLVSLKAQTGMADLFGIKAVNDYPDNWYFVSKNHLAYVQIIAYEYILNTEFGVSLDSILQHAFNDLTSKLKINNLSISFPSQSAPILEKIRFLLPEMETLLKRYKLYVEHGYIDPELLAISSTPCKIQNIPSSVVKKYVYGIESKLQRILHLFFSDQTALYYVDPFKGKYDSLFDLLWNENVLWANLQEYQRTDYQWLIHQGYLTIEDGYVRLKNEREILVFRELYENEVISYWHYTEDSRTVFDNLIEQGYLEFGCSLLTKLEIDYFNYYLNKSEFTNGADLRNKYAHGSHNYDEETMKSDYYRLLILLALLEWKIVDDIILTERTNRII